MKVNSKTTNAANLICHQGGQRTVNGIVGNTRRGIQVDQTLDPDSNNPVANKPVSTALAALAGQLAKGQVVFLDQLPESGEPHKVYVLTATNQRYWWDGNKFVKIVPTASGSANIISNDMIHYTAEEGKVYDKLVFPNGDKYAQYFPLEGDVGTSYYYRAKRVDFSENEDEPDKISLSYIKFLLDGGKIKRSSVDADLPKYEAFEGVQTKANNSLQKPEIAPTKTKLVGVGTNGQENIEIGDNLTLANGKLSATGGGSSANILVGSAPEQSDNGYQGTYSGVPDNSKINVLHIPDFGDFVLTFSTDGVYNSYINDGDTNISIFLSEGDYTIEFKSASSETPINVITKGDGDDTFNGTLVSPGLTLFYYKVPNQSFYVTIPVSSTGMWGTGTIFGFDDDSIDVYVFFEALKKYEVKKYNLKYYTHFITMTNSIDNVVLYLTIQKGYIFETGNEFNVYTLAEYLAGKKVLVNGNLHGVVPTYIAGEGGKIKIYYRTPGDNNINPTPDEYQDLSSFTITDLVTPVD